MMDEKELFNRDTLFWRELNSSLPAKSAVLNLKVPVIIDGQEHKRIDCLLLPYVAHQVEYQMDNGGSFLKNEVKEWQFVDIKDQTRYEDDAVSPSDKQKLVQIVEHQKVQSIQLKDDNGNVILEKFKI